MQLIVKEVLRFGKKTYYPACEKSETLSSLMDKKSFTENVLSQIKSLGFEVKIILD